MQAFLNAQAVSLTIPLIDNAGECLSVSAVEYRVIDQNETVLVARSGLTDFNSGDTQVIVNIPGASNTLTAGAVRALHLVELYLNTDDGTIKLTQEYLIEAEQTLVESVNSFQNYSRAVLAGYDLTNLPGWMGATKEARITALVEARRNIGKLRFRYVFDAYQNIIENTVGVADLTLASAAQWQAMPVEFKEAICRAQVIEADFLLGGDPVGDKRRAGVLSETVGESSTFLRQIKPLDGPVCRRAMKELGKFILRRVRVTRT